MDELLRELSGLSLGQKITRVRRESAHDLAANLASLSLTGKRLLREREIVAMAQPLEALCGVYFLVKAGAVIYVGQSTDIGARIRDHRSGKAMDAVGWVQCQPEQLDVLEALYIHLLEPLLNEAPVMSLEKILQRLGVGRKPELGLVR